MRSPTLLCLLAFLVGCVLLPSPALAQGGGGPGGGGPGGPGGGGVPPQMLQRMNQMLDSSRQAGPDQWTQMKPQMLDRMSANMKAQNSSNPDAVEAALAEVGRILEEARAMAAEEYDAQKQALATRLARAVGQGMGRSPGGGGGPGGQGGNRTPGPRGPGGEPRDDRSRNEPKALAEGDPAPDFVLTTIDGKAEVKLSEYFGKRPICLVFGSYT